MTRFLVIGIFQGAVYGLLAVGIVLVYRGTRVFNFAQGEFGTVAAFAAWWTLDRAGLPYGVALLAGLAAAIALGLLTERIVIRPLLEAPRLTVLVASIGAALFVIAATFVIAKPETRTMPPMIEGRALDILGAGISIQQLLVLAVLGALAAGLAVFFSRTDTGLSILAVSQDRLAARTVGISVPKVSRMLWAMAAALGGIAGLLQAPIGIFAPGFMTTSSLVPAFTAAVLGGMTSLPGAFLGGELVGIAQNLGIHLLGQRLDIPGASELTVFVLLVGVLALRPQGLLGKEA